MSKTYYPTKKKEKRIPEIPENINEVPNIITEHLTKQNKLNIYNMTIKDRNKYFSQNIIPTLPKDIKEDNSLKYLLSFHGGINDNSENFTIPENVYIISLEKGGLLFESEITNYLFLKIGMLNSISNDFFTNISKEILFTESQIIQNRNYNIEQKKFQLYLPKSKFYNYTIETEENNKFHTGLFSLPIKPFYVDNNHEIIHSYENILEMINDNEVDISSLKCILNPFSEKCNGRLFFESEYYTLHCKYLNYYKKHFKNTENMHCLSEYIKAKKNNDNSPSKVNLSSIVKLLVKNRKKNNSKKPIILILDTCTLKEDYEYQQNEILKPFFNENHRKLNNQNLFLYDYENNRNFTDNFDYNNIKNERKEYIIKSIKRFLDYIENELKLDITNLNSNKIENFTKSLLENIIDENNINFKKLIINNEEKVKLYSLFNNFIFNPILYNFNYKYDYYNYSSINTDIIILYIFNIQLQSSFSEKQIIFLQSLAENAFKYYLLLLLLNISKNINTFKDNYKKEFKNFSFFENIFSEINTKEPSNEDNFKYNYHVTNKNTNYNEYNEYNFNNNENDKYLNYRNQDSKLTLKSLFKINKIEDLINSGKNISKFIDKVTIRNHFMNQFIEYKKNIGKDFYILEQLTNKKVYI